MAVGRVLVALAVVKVAIIHRKKKDGGCTFYHNTLRTKLTIASIGREIVFRERTSRKTVIFEEQITSADKYPRIFSRIFTNQCVIFKTRSGNACMREIRTLFTKHYLIGILIFC